MSRKEKIRIDDIDELLSKGGSMVPVPDKVRNRVMATIEENTRPVIDTRSSFIDVVMSRTFRYIAVSVSAVVAVLLLFLYNRDVSTDGKDFIASLQGEVVRIQKDDIANLDRGYVLQSGDVIRTWYDSFCIVQLSDKSVLNIHRRSRFHYTSETGTIHNRKEIHLMDGAILADVNKQFSDSGFIISTPHCLVRVVGTRYIVAVKYDRTIVLVNDGSVQVTTIKESRKDVVVPKGYMAVVDHEQLFTKPLNSQEGILFEQFDKLSFEAYMQWFTRPGHWLKYKM